MRKTIVFTVLLILLVSPTLATPLNITCMEPRTIGQSLNPGPLNFIPRHIGPYKVMKVIEWPLDSNLADIEFYNGSIYLLEEYNGLIHELDPKTGNTVDTFYINGLTNYWLPPGNNPTNSLHDDWPFDNPRGLAQVNGKFYMATRLEEELLRELALNEPFPETIDPNKINRFKDQYGPTDLAPSSDGNLFYSEYLGDINKIDPQTANVIYTIPSPSDFIYGLTFDGENLIAVYGPGGDQGKTFWLLDSQTGQVLETWTNQRWPDYISGLSYDQNTDTLYITTADRIIIAQKPQTKYKNATPFS
ncbi:MAG: hypothetical protein ABH864_00845 [archaeon]